MTHSWEETQARIDERLTDLRGQVQQISEARGDLPRRKRRRPDPQAPDADKLASLRDELRGLISDAHGATKDLRAMVLEYREVIATAGETLAEVMAAGANHALRQWANHMQQEQNRTSAELNRGIERAQQLVVGALVHATVKTRPDGDTEIRFRGPKMDEAFPAPFPGAGLPSAELLSGLQEPPEGPAS